MKEVTHTHNQNPMTALAPPHAAAATNAIGHHHPTFDARQNPNVVPAMVVAIVPYAATHTAIWFSLGKLSNTSWFFTR